jgi:outer membrane protein assembly factor BamA
VIEVTGLRRTRPEVVLRELPLRAGDPVDWTRLERSRFRLLDLHIFADVGFRPRRDPATDRPVLEVRVVERPDWYALPTFEYEEEVGFTLGLSATTLNLGGMARRAWASVGWGGHRYVSGGYATNWAIGRRLGLGLGATRQRGRNLSQGTIEERTGGSVAIAPARGPRVSFPCGLGWEEVRSRPDPEPGRGFDGVAERGRDDHRWMQAGARVDTRDYRARPRRGGVLAAYASAHGGLLGGTTAMERYALDAMVVRPAGPVVVTVGSRAILSRGGVPSFLRLGLGGATSLRGHAPGEYEGENRWIGWLEGRFPLFSRHEVTLPAPLTGTADLTIDGAVFLDAGSAWEAGEMSRGVARGHWGAGAGLRLVLPLAGLLNVDLATDGRHVEAHVLTGPRF